MLDTRTEKFTEAEFKSLKRNSEGRIVDDFDLASCFFTEEQIEELQSDDWSRYQALQEELKSMMMEFA